MVSFGSSVCILVTLDYLAKCPSATPPAHSLYSDSSNHHRKMLWKTSRLSTLLSVVASLVLASRNSHTEPESNGLQDLVSLPPPWEQYCTNAPRIGDMGPALHYSTGRASHDIFRRIPSIPPPSPWPLARRVPKNKEHGVHWCLILRGLEPC